MRVLRNKLAPVLTLVLLVGGASLLLAPHRAFACGFGSALSGSNPAVTTSSAESFTPTTANLFASLSSLGTTGACQGFLTTAGGSTWTVPADWNNASNTIEAIGAGASGTAGSSGGAGGTGAQGGGGGGYAELLNQTMSGTVGYDILDPAAGLACTTAGYTTATYICSDNTSNCSIPTGVCTSPTYGSSIILAAQNGSSAGTTGGAGGTGIIGTNFHTGGKGAAGGGAGAAGGGGGGAAGLRGIGGNASGATGGTGDNGTVAAGASGTEWDSTHGSGGGGAGGSRAAGGQGGLYGAGGGGGQGSGNAGGVGRLGIIVITYTPSGSGVTQSGFAYSTDSTLKTGVSTTTLGSQGSTGTFTGGITGLTADTTYFYRAYATNSTGTAYGSILSFVTGNTTPTRRIRLFEGFKLKLFESGKLKVLQQ